MAKSKSAEKGYRAEAEIKNRLIDAGIPAERVPISGAAGGNYSGDLIIDGRLQAEIKARGTGAGFALMERWLEGNDVLITKRDRAEPFVSLSWQTFLDLMRNSDAGPWKAGRMIMQEIELQ